MGIYNSRSECSLGVRKAAAELAKGRVHKTHTANGEEFEYRAPVQCDNGQRASRADQPTHLANFTKGLPHDPVTGLLLNPADYGLFVRGIESGDPADFIATPLGPAADPSARSPSGCPTVTAINCDSPPTAAVWLSAVAKTGSFDSVSSENASPVGLRAWESAGAGHAFELEGPDPQSVSMPPAPRLDSPELAAELAEVYSQALLRDHHVSELRLPINGNGPTGSSDAWASVGVADDTKTAFDLDEAIALLSLQSEWFGLSDHPQPAGVRLSRFLLDSHGEGDEPPRRLTEAERLRLRPSPNRQSVFRGVTPGDQVGPYLSQFLLIGNSGINASDQDRTIDQGLISYGAVTVNQRVRIALPCRDYMTTFAEYIDVQNGARLGGLEKYVVPSDHHCSVSGGEGAVPGYRFITTPRDLATYVHYDALYESYLNACLLLLGLGVPFDRGLPFQRDDVVDHQQGFALFGPPHILTLVTEVATRALKAVRFQKFNVHRRLRPEALAARVAKFPEFWNGGNACRKAAFAPMRPLHDRLSRKADSGRSILDWVVEHNTKQIDSRGLADNPLALLPMAFPEGSPMHPSYGAGHATVAGACVTILKAFFDAGTELWEEVNDNGRSVLRPICYEPSADGCRLVSLLDDNAHDPATNNKGGRVPSLGRRGPEQPDKLNAFDNAPLVVDREFDFQPLTVEGELNKLASNISIGRDWAGVHYYTDYLESLRLGEQIALGILEEQKLTYRENFTMTVPLFDGGSVRI